MNKTYITGRVANDVTLKKTTSGKSVTDFNVAVESYSKGTEKTVDFFKCVAWNNTAEFITRNFQKGKPIIIIGHLKTNNYTDNNGNKHYDTFIVVDEVEFMIREKNQKSENEFADVIEALGDFEDVTPY